MRARQLPDESRDALLGLEADRSDTGRAAFMAALREYHEAGWSYRRLGAALGRSHESVRRLIEASGDANSPLAAPSGSPSKPTVLATRKLPVDVAEDLNARFRAAVELSPGEKTGPLSPPAAAFYAGLAGAVAAGWDAHEIGTALGIHPRAAGRFATAYAKQGGPAAIPEYGKAPERGAAAWNARHPVEPPVLVSDEDRARLSGLREGASMTSGAEQASVEYTRLLACWYLRGASREELEAATGQQWTTLRRRLLRWGVMRDPRQR